jgi:signal transduction histidine kinase
VRSPPALYLSRVQVSGEEQPLPARGVREFALGELPYDHDNLLVEYTAVAASSDGSMRYQTRLEGVDADWSAPESQPSVRYAGLAPGGYRFFARAIDQESGAVSEPARLEFRVLAPLWRRPWFLAACALAGGAAALAWHRVRLRQALALERIRSQIALDLHDDLGANLSQIAILSEVARRGPAAEAGGKLGQIAELARSMRESMGDIVWAVDPRKDRASELVRRMRQAGNALVESDGLALDFRAPPEAEIEGLELAPDQRRHLLMMFKEALNNVVRHARASRVEVELARRGSELVLSVRDDGRGFAVGSPSPGNGLRNLHVRAQALHGRADVSSGPGEGTRVRVTVPLRPA